MTSWVRTLRLGLISGTLAGVASTLALAAASRAEGKTAFQPANSTSHWLNGKQAGDFEGADLAHTAVGLATHQAATLFWAVIFERWIDARRPLPALATLRDALALSAVAAAVDYSITPKRFTPGWEFVLSKRSMAAGYAAMAAGLAAGALATQPRKLAAPYLVRRRPAAG